MWKWNQRAFAFTVKVAPSEICWMWQYGTFSALLENIPHFQFVSHLFKFDNSFEIKMQNANDSGNLLGAKEIALKFLVQQTLCNQFCPRRISQQPPAVTCNRLGNTYYLLGTICQMVTDLAVDLCNSGVIGFILGLAKATFPAVCAIWGWGLHVVFFGRNVSQKKYAIREGKPKEIDLLETA